MPPGAVIPINPILKQYRNAYKPKNTKMNFRYGSDFLLRLSDLIIIFFLKFSKFFLDFYINNEPKPETL